MSGAAEISIQPSQIRTLFLLGATNPAGQWLRGIPKPGLQNSGGGPLVPAVAGQPDCSSLLAGSPPSLLEAYEIYSYSIGWAVSIGSQDGAFAPGVTGMDISAEVALLVNGQVRTVQTVDAVASEPPSGGTPRVSSSWSADLVNPITVGARDRLSLRAGLRVPDYNTGAILWVGSQMAQDGAGGVDIQDPFESTISYRVLDLPGSRRL